MLLTNVAGESKCPRGHLLILIHHIDTLLAQGEEV